MHMLVENATSPWGQSWEWVFHKHSCIQFIALVPSALVLWTVCTCACGKPIPKIAPMAKLDIPKIAPVAKLDNYIYPFIFLSIKSHFLALKKWLLPLIKHHNSVILKQNILVWKYVMSYKLKCAYEIYEWSLPKITARATMLEWLWMPDFKMHNA